MREGRFAVVGQKNIGYLLKDINDKIKLRADADLRHYNLTFTQSRVFLFLHSRGGQATQKEIEVFLEVSHPTVVGIVSRMEQKGHVVSWFDEKDKRNKIVKLTEEAKTMSRDMEHNIQTNEKNMLASLSDDDVRHLRKMLMTISKNLE